MTKSEAKPTIAKAVNELFSKSPDGLREIVRGAVMQEMLEAEMTDALGAEKWRELYGCPARLSLLRLLPAHPRHPRPASSSCACRRDRDGRFSTELFEDAISAPSRP